MGESKPSEDVGVYTAAERAAVVAYLKDRAAWLHREAHAGGEASLRTRAGELEIVAKLIGWGRHHQGGHLGG